MKKKLCTTCLDNPNSDTRSVTIYIQPIPYPNVERCDEYFVDQEGTLDDFAGYIRTWSGFQTFQEAEGDAKAIKVIEDFVKQSKEICGFKVDSEIIFLRTSFFLLLGIKPA